MSMLGAEMSRLRTVLSSGLGVAIRLMEWYSWFTAWVVGCATHWLGPYRTILVTSMMWWGLSLLLNSTSTFDTSESYALMRGLASKEFWGVVYVFMPILVITGRILNSWFTEQISVLLMSLGWVFVAATFLYANPWSTGSAIYSSMALLLLMDWRIKEITQDHE